MRWPTTSGFRFPPFYRAVRLLLAACAVLAAAPQAVGAGDLEKAQADYAAADFTAALEAFRRLGAFQETAEAQFMAGEMTRLGLGTEPDRIQAAEWYRRAALLGHGNAQFALGRLLVEHPDLSQAPGEAMKWLRNSFSQDIADAGFFIGFLYEKGRHVIADPQRAVRWYERAAENGSNAARFRLAEMSFKGDGMAQNYGRALDLIKAAAESGHAPAQLALARLYRTGLPGRPELHANPIWAYFWANLAAAAGEPDAVTLRDELAERLAPTQLASAQERAAAWRAENLPD